MTEENKMPRLKKIHIKGFKAIDEIELEFPKPKMKNDPDIFVLGSKNGVGKTSILEAIALFFINTAAHFDGKAAEDENITNTLTPTYSDKAIRSGVDHADIKGDYEITGFDESVSFELQVLHEAGRKKSQSSKYPHALAYFYEFIWGKDPEPLLMPPLLFFHSFRKVQEGNPNMSSLVQREGSDGLGQTYLDKNDPPISNFKMEMLRALMSQGGLFENLNNTDSKEVLQVLNGLMREFAGGYIDKVRPAPDNTIEFRVTPLNGGPTFNFDGLSSGQKEIISTLFLIWRYTKDRPSLVLIDEPELHLNSEWHRRFIRHLYKMAPQNQYIIATHSEDVFSSVDPDRRIMIATEGDPA